jgi:hypothetical protein
MMKSTSAQRYARICGALYLYIIVGGTFMGLFVRPELVVSGNAVLTAERLLARESFLRLGIFAELLTIASDVGVATLLYLLFRPVGRAVALLAAFMRLAADIILALSSLLHFAALQLVHARPYLEVIGESERQALALLSLELHSDAYAICLFMFGFALLALGYLIYKAAYVPTLIGVLVAIAPANASEMFWIMLALLRAAIAERPVTAMS